MLSPARRLAGFVVVGSLVAALINLAGSVAAMSIFGYTLALLAFVYLREGSYRVGSGDSGSRMMVHAVFVVIVYVVLAASAALARDNGADEAQVPDAADEIRGGGRSRLRGVA